MSWHRLETDNPELAAFGKARLHGLVGYLATTRKDGSPRVHPVTPIIGEGHFFLFMEPTSPKRLDLIRDGRYSLHCAVSDNSGESGEFYISGTARLVDDSETRKLATRLSTYAPADRYILFEFDIVQASSTLYPEGKPVRTRWQVSS
jgi:hypothetical protein